MSDIPIEQRLSKLEEQVSALSARLDEASPKKNWIEALQSNATPLTPEDRQAMQEVDEYIRQAREDDRERSIAQMDQKRFFPVKPDKHAWRSTVGMFGDDPILREIADEALKYREEDRAKARRAAEVEPQP